MASVIYDRGHILKDLVGIGGVAVEAAIGEACHSSVPTNDITVFSRICFCAVYTYARIISVNRTDVDGDVS